MQRDNCDILYMQFFFFFMQQLHKCCYNNNLFFLLLLLNARCHNAVVFYTTILTIKKHRILLSLSVFDSC